jgi:hypothetical protein
LTQRAVLLLRRKAVCRPFAGKFAAGDYPARRLFLPYKQEVAWSSQAPPTFSKGLHLGIVW